nr:MAG TPA: hypothetical protein [Caudoviricetes sp.]
MSTLKCTLTRVLTHRSLMLQQNLLNNKIKIINQ